MGSCQGRQRTARTLAAAVLAVLALLTVGHALLCAHSSGSEFRLAGLAETSAGPVTDVSGAGSHAAPVDGRAFAAGCHEGGVECCEPADSPADLRAAAGGPAVPTLIALAWLLGALPGSRRSQPSALRRTGPPGMVGPCVLSLTCVSRT
ncbi:hypothetical protein GCM10009665_06900 [Kitasatospora nipponensis]|uniref:MYXO-CTERM domain-containing protein n=1 Tax=Kitasatospora nipponensis TaxID=258049 RepID=A0ABN1VQ62_9ACTN